MSVWLIVSGVRSSCDALVEAAAGDAAGGGGDLLQGMQCPACQEPPESGSDDADGPERDERGNEHGVEGVVSVPLELGAQRLLRLVGCLLRAWFGGSRCWQVLGDAGPRCQLTVEGRPQVEVHDCD